MIPNSNMTAARLAEMQKAFPARHVKNKDGTDSGFIMTGPCRLMWPVLAEAKEQQPGQKPKFSATLIFPKDADLSVMKELAKGKAVAEFKADAKSARSPFRKQEDKAKFDGFLDDETAFFIAASSMLMPAIFGLGAERLVQDTAAVYAGCWVVAKVNVYSYSNLGNKGVSFGLTAVQKICDDEPLKVGGMAASEGIEAVPHHILAQGGINAGAAGDETTLPGW